jgi:hypothetical protein
MKNLKFFKKSLVKLANIRNDIFRGVLQSAAIGAAIGSATGAISGMA